MIKMQKTMYMSRAANRILVRELIDGELRKEYSISNGQLASLCVNSLDRGFEVYVNFKVIFPPIPEKTALEEKVVA